MFIYVYLYFYNFIQILLVYKSFVFSLNFLQLLLQFNYQKILIEDTIII